jgi:pSer/pThr/pTyr-binding forkhead associated (FHA) protein
MPECPKCGVEVEYGAASCVACGNAISDDTTSFKPVGVDTPSEVAVSQPEGPVLVVSKGPQLGERFYIDRPTLSVGRDPECDIFLNDMTVSRAHARFDLDQSTLTVTDLGSLNGTYVNGTIVDKAQIAGGDIVQIGTFQMVYFDSSEAQRG